MGHRRQPVSNGYPFPLIFSQYGRIPVRGKGCTATLYITGAVISVASAKPFPYIPPGRDAAATRRQRRVPRGRVRSTAAAWPCRPLENLPALQVMCLQCWKARQNKTRRRSPQALISTLRSTGFTKPSVCLLKECTHCCFWPGLPPTNKPRASTCTCT